MNDPLLTIVIKRASYPPAGSDTKVCRAYSPGVNGRPDQPLGISASSTNCAAVAALRCAAKAFKKFTEPKSDPDEIETRIILNALPGGLWIATLQPK